MFAGINTSASVCWVGWFVSVHRVHRECWWDQTLSLTLQDRVLFSTFSLISQEMTHGSWWKKSSIAVPSYVKARQREQYVLAEMRHLVLVKGSGSHSCDTGSWIYNPFSSPSFSLLTFTVNMEYETINWWLGRSGDFTQTHTKTRRRTHTCSWAKEGAITGCSDPASTDVICLMNILNTGGLIH